MYISLEPIKVEGRMGLSTHSLLCLLEGGGWIKGKGGRGGGGKTSSGTTITFLKKP